MSLITLNIKKVVAYQNLNIVRHRNWMFEWIVMGALYTQVTTQNVKLTFLDGWFLKRSPLTLNFDGMYFFQL